MRWLVLAAVGCGGDKATPADGEGDADTDADADADTDTDADADSGSTAPATGETADTAAPSDITGEWVGSCFAGGVGVLLRGRVVVRPAPGGVRRRGRRERAGDDRDAADRGPGRQRRLDHHHDVPILRGGADRGDGPTRS
jgi:hypothetical protein